MTLTITPKAALAALFSGCVLLFALGANGQNDSDNPRWAISAVSGENSGAYVIDQTSGEVYFIRINPNASTRDLKIKRLGNMSEAR